jgi:hypothetical protein
VNRKNSNAKIARIPMTILLGTGIEYSKLQGSQSLIR